VGVDSCTRALSGDSGWSGDNLYHSFREKGEFFSSMRVHGKQDNYKWEVINVYGPVQIERKAIFLEELHQKISSIVDPCIIGGDFNMIRFPWEKSTDNVNQLWMDNFNSFIKDNGLKEMHRKGSKFT
jgi:hypothetical protein